jgi:hypothetical protein
MRARWSRWLVRDHRDRIAEGAGPAGQPSHPFTVGVLALRQLTLGGDDGAPMPGSNDESMDAARMRGECENERHNQKSADLEKAKILLAWACRVYGSDEDAKEPEYNQFLQIGCAIANITPETLARASINEVVAHMLAEDRVEAERLLASAQRDRGRPATPHKHLWIMGTIEAYIGAGLRRKAAIHRTAPIGGLVHQQSTKSTRTTSLLSL